MYTVTIALENHFQINKTILEISHHTTLIIEVDHLNREILEIFHKIDIVDQIVETTTHDQTQTRCNNNHQITNQIETEAIQTINHETRLIIEIDTIQIIEIEITRTIEIEAIPTTVIIIQTIDHETTHTTDQTITDQITINTIDRETIHKIEILVIIIDTEIIHNHHIETIIIITIPNIDIEAIHQNIKDK